MLKKIMFLTATVALTACGGSSDSISVPNPGSGGDINYPKLIVGTINAISVQNVTVNDYSWPTEHVVVQYGDNMLSQHMLTEGAAVRVYTDGKKLSTIELNPTIAGEASKVESGSMTVAGVTMNYDTIANDIRNGDYVLVSTNKYSDVIDVTAVTKLSSAPLYSEIEGRISEIIPGSSTFVINDILIDYSAAVIEGGPVNAGAWVEVFGQFEGHVFIAYEVDVEGYSNTNDIEIEGVVTWVDPQQVAFELNNHIALEVSPQTRFKDGTQRDLAVGKVIDVKIKNTNDSSLVSEIDFQYEMVPPVSGKPQNYELFGRASYSNSVLIVNGFTFKLDPQTRFDDGLTLGQLDGAELEIDGVFRDGAYWVREIERKDHDREVSLEGLVENGGIWGYSASDRSLEHFEGLWVELECFFDGLSLSQCQID
ncbi:hypothetical protein EIK76_17225 [Rheinheimera mesophila]|uniref:DUF5666 domain-containing protein n=1 Tax=Rheinheimera mesophila TaxID=1547515 RepID=A0A3P3QBN8_9GAMM|nr:DUF5666 domain-containing protein [Rheinheimera mesophila]KKL00506.1 hypothetical protein SD53_14510 [Rheinheimera mesophila]RRJ18498.1 hypothetical protein EIK76_17225 [Rheinheimera mesophila]